MWTDIKRGVLFTVVTMTLFAGGYHLFIWGLGRVLFPAQAEGSLIRRADGAIAGSSLIAQAFTKPEYFHPRPSGVDYNAASTGGTNFSNGNADQMEGVRDRLATVITEEGVAASQVPSEMVTASGSGLDPHIPPNAAELQTLRVAKARNVDVSEVRELLRTFTQAPTFGVFGRERVNVLELNLALDDRFGRPAQVRK